MPIWKVIPTLDALQNRSQMSLGALIGIQFTEIGDDYIRASLPVGPRTHQPFGRLHGGASATLAEEVGSVASNLCLDHSKHLAVGLELNCNHLRGVSSGTVTATARPLHLGRATHVWDIRIENEQQQLICVARLTTSIIEVNRMLGNKP